MLKRGTDPFLFLWRAAIHFSKLQLWNVQVFPLISVAGLVETIFDSPIICFFVDMDVSMPDEILRHCGCLFLSGEESGHSGEDREEGAGLKSHHGSFRWEMCWCSVNVKPWL